MRSNLVGASRTTGRAHGINRPAVLGASRLLFAGLYQVCQVTAVPISEFVGLAYEGEDPDVEDSSLWFYLTVAAVLVLLGGAFAGLTIA
jgi:metal transporter CNNM